MFHIRRSKTNHRASRAQLQLASLQGHGLSLADMQGILGYMPVKCWPLIHTQGWLLSFKVLVLAGQLSCTNLACIPSGQAWQPQPWDWGCSLGASRPLGGGAQEPISLTYIRILSSILNPDLLAVGNQHRSVDTALCTGLAFTQQHQAGAWTLACSSRCSLPVWGSET